jgi:hypothetical protein
LAEYNPLPFRKVTKEGENEKVKAKVTRNRRRKIEKQIIDMIKSPLEPTAENKSLPNGEINMMMRPQARASLECCAKV